ncbi:hypothetical protein GUJ93_ZPchr0004g40417 [Zizania palustris]|uniref:Uncharacterized protein n=1 Tax=Zizania palustris TaxID=103762 RepID=A0A8J5SNE8_ZIZPA|nr:hypothetical protein GUJ93_ZPchr0004g40417 [Zizania palustris]
MEILEVEKKAEEVRSIPLVEEQHGLVGSQEKAAESPSPCLASTTVTSTSASTLVAVTGCWHHNLKCSPTELSDDIFIAMSLNHGLSNGYTLWHMFNTWSEIDHIDGDKESRGLSMPLPMLKIWVVDGFLVSIPRPFAKFEDTQLLLVH